jgi:cell division protein FtsB
MKMPRFRLILICAVASFLICVSVVTFMKELGRVDRVSETLETRMRELVETSRKNQELQDKITYYRTPEGIAYLAREHFNLVKRGEKIYRIEVVSGDKEE